MAVFMFWNLAGNPIQDLVSAACREHQVDVLIVAEAENIDRADFLRCLNSGGEVGFSEFDPVPSTVRFFIRYPIESFQAVFDDGRVSIRNLRPPLGPSLLIAGAHLPSKLHREQQDQSYTVRMLRANINEAEQKVRHSNSIVIGDLNMNPFEEGMIAADGLHAAMTKEIAQGSPRIVQGKAWDYFYNPMWSRLGDESPGPAGTYYRRGSSVVEYFWHTFDQVLIRPALVPYYRRDSVRVISRIGETSLMSQSGIERRISDHLPLVLTLHTETGR